MRHGNYDQYLSKNCYDRLISWCTSSKQLSSPNEKMWLEQFKLYLTIKSGPQKDRAEFFAKLALKYAFEHGFDPEKDSTTSLPSDIVSLKEFNHIINELEQAVHQENISTFIPRRSKEDIIRTKDPDFLIVKYSVNNSAMIEHPIPIQKFNDLEKLLMQKGSMSISEIMREVNFRKDDQTALKELLRQLGHTVRGEMVFVRVGKTG